MILLLKIMEFHLPHLYPSMELDTTSLTCIKMTQLMTMSMI